MTSSSPTSSSNRGPNPLAFLGLRRVGDEPENDPPPLPGSPSKGGVMLNRRGLPARKRKKNSLIYGMDEVVSIPVRSPKKKGNNSKTRDSSNKESDRLAEIREETEDDNEDDRDEEKEDEDAKEELTTRKRTRRHSPIIPTSPKPKIGTPTRRTRATASSLTATVIIHN